MKKSNSKKSNYSKKKTVQGGGKFTKTPQAGGERFIQGYREGTPPSKARRKKKPYRRQGR